MGQLLVILSSLGFSTLGIFGRYAYDAGYSRNQALFWRFALSMPVLLLIMIFSRARPASARSFMRAVLLGAIGIGVEATLYFMTIEQVGVGLTGIFLYLYPSFVALISHFFLKEKIKGRMAVGLALALLGTVMTAAGGNSAFSISPLAHPIGLIYGLATAAWYAIYLLVGNRILKNEHPLVVSFGICVGAFMSFLALCLYEVEQGALFEIPHDYLSSYAVVGLALAATVVPLSCLYSGMKRIGALSASLFSTLEMVFTVLFAWALLGEKLSFIQGGGAVLILLSVLLTEVMRTS